MPDIEYFKDWGTSPGLFMGKKRVAWWPAGYDPTPDRLELALKLVWARETDEPLKRGDLITAFQAP